MIPVPVGSITGCTDPGNPLLGPSVSAVVGCVTALETSPLGLPGGETITPSHGYLTPDGNSLLYTPIVGYTGTDTFTVQALVTNTDRTTALSSGDITVNVIDGPATPEPSTFWLAAAAAVLAMIGFRVRHLRA